MKKKTGLLSLVLSALAWIFGGILMLGQMENMGNIAVLIVMIAWLMCTLAAVILGIWSIAKKHGYRPAAIAGIVTSIPLLLFELVVWYVLLPEINRFL